MILKHFAHQGSIAFPERVEVPFDDLPAILGVGGKTGAGKTSLLEMLTLARHGHTAYRDTAPAKQFGPRGGFTELVCIQGQENIHSRITVEGDRAEGMLWRDGAQKGGPLIKDFRREALSIFGTLDLFRCTGYAVQPKAHGKDTTGSFLRSDRGSRKEIFAAMLGLNTYERRQAVAKDRAKVLLEQVELVRARTQEHEAVVARSSKVLEARQQVTERIEAAHARIEAATRRVDQAREQGATLAGEKAALESKRPQLEQFDREIADLQLRIRDAETRRKNNEGVLERATEIQRAVDQDEALKLEQASLEPMGAERTRLQREVAKIEDRIGRLHRALAEVEATLARIPEIEAAVNRTAVLNGALTALDGELETARTTHQAAVSAFHAAEMLRQERAGKATEASRLADDADKLAARLQQLRLDLEDAARLEAQAPDIQDAVVRTAALTEQRDALTKQIEAVRVEHEAAVREFHAAEMRRQSRDAKLVEKRRLEQDTAIIETVPCHGEGPARDCQFLLRAGEATNLIRLINDELQALDSRLATAPTENPPDPTPPLTDALRQIQAQIDTLHPLTMLAAGLEAAVERAARLRTEIATGEEEVARVRDSQAVITAKLTALDEGLVGAPTTAPVDPVPTFAARRLELQQKIQGLANLVSLSSGIEPARKDQRELTEEINGLQVDANKVVADLDDVGLRLARIPVIEAERQKLAPTVTLKPRVEQARARIEELDRTIAQCEADEATRTQARDVLKAELARVGTLDAEIRQHEDVEAKAAEEIRTERQSLNTLNAELGAVNGQVEAIERSRDALARAEAELRPMLEDVPEWNLLARAYGPTGIPTLKIDQALPEVSATATALLRDCFGESLFTLVLTTQKLAADESKLLETFELTIIRDGKEISVDDLSGGEGALVSEGLALGMAVFNTRRSGRPLKTLMRDEVSAPLDPETAVAYVRMLRRVADLGRYRHIIFVSHQPRSLAAADAVITVADGRIAIA